MAVRPTTDSALGFCSNLQTSSYISSSPTPNGANSIAIQVLNKHMLGVLLTSGDEPAPPGDLESSFFCAPSRYSQTVIPETQSPAWFLAHSRPSNIDDQSMSPRSKTG